MLEQRTCTYCKKEFEINSGNKRKTCSRECMRLYAATPEHKQLCKERRMETNIRKYGNPTYNNPKAIKEAKVGSVYNAEKQRETLMNKYGDPTYRNIDKSKETKLKKYGDEFFRNPELSKNTKLERYGDAGYTNRDKAKRTMLEKYGDLTYCNKSKIKETFIERYGVENYAQTDDFKRIMFEKVIRRLINDGRVIPLFDMSTYAGVTRVKYEFKCNLCETIFDSSIDMGRFPVCPTCFPKESGISLVEKEIFDYISTLYSGEIISNDRVILNGKELDIVIPQLKLAIELNGVYWHGESSGKSKRYHLEKTLACREAGIHLIHIWDSEWIRNQSIVKHLLRNLICSKDSQKIGARHCSISEVEFAECNEFLEMNHLQGGDKSSVRIGLYNDGKLVSVMTFGKNRYGKDAEWEMYRYCSSMKIIGGASKLFKYFLLNWNPSSIKTFSNNRWFTGEIYEKLGFSLVGDTPPNYFYTKSGNVYTRERFQKHKLSKILEKFNPNLTEVENMMLNGFDRVWDCGNKKWLWKNEK